MNESVIVLPEPPGFWQRIGRALAGVAAGLYLPFGWLLVTSVQEREHSLQWIKLWPILPGFFPGAYLIHPSTAVEFAVMGLMTLGLLVSLVSLGSASPRRLRVASGVALLVSIPSSIVAYVCFRS